MAGFAWLDALRALGGTQARQFARHVVLAWFTDTAAYDSLAWSSDLLSARLRRCLMNSAFLETNSDALFRAHLFRPLNRQAEHLARVLPDGLNGGALMKASIALMLAGALLPPQGSKAGDKWLRKGGALLDRELHAQILADGGHVERSPAVMLDLLQHLLDLHHVLMLTGRKLPDQLISSIGNLACALKLVTHPDGGLALFNDSTEDESSAVIMTLMRAGATGAVERDLVQLPQTGFHRMAAGRSVLISRYRPAARTRPRSRGTCRHAVLRVLGRQRAHDRQLRRASDRRRVAAGPARDRRAFRAGRRRYQFQHAAAVRGARAHAALGGGAARADRRGAMARCAS
jgi:uncharacterized heparinase superfamily protein